MKKLMCKIEGYLLQERCIQIVVSIVGLMLTLLATYSYAEGVLINTYRDSNYTARVYSNKVEHMLARYSYKSEILKAVVVALDGNISEDIFMQTAENLISPGILSVQYAHNAIISFVYPKDSNELPVGESILQHPQRKEDALLAIESKSCLVSGPYTLYHGIPKLVVRNPIFSGETLQDFVGFSILVVDLDTFIEWCELEQLTEFGYEYALTYENQNGSITTVAQSANFTPNSNQISKPVSYNGRSWTLTITTPFHLSYLSGCVVIFLFGMLITLYLRRMLVKLVQNNAFMRYSSLHDPLTDLYNRKMIEEFIANEKKKQNTLSGIMLLLDLDNFKKVNDQLGHIEGDRVLVEIAHILNGTFRDSDIKVRLGGDEFMVYIPNLIPRTRLEQMLNDLLGRIHTELHLYYETCMLSASIGAAVSYGTVDSFEQMYQLADHAMYKAKQSGKNGYYILEHTTEHLE